MEQDEEVIRAALILMSMRHANVSDLSLPQNVRVHSHEGERTNGNVNIVPQFGSQDIHCHDRASMSTPRASEFSTGLSSLNDVVMNDLDASAANIDKSDEKPRFNILAALLDQEDIILYLTTQLLEPSELFALYRAYKPFYLHVNQYMTHFILSSARRWARLTPDRPTTLLSSPKLRPPPGPTKGTPTFAERLRERRILTGPRRIRQACGTEPTPAGVYSTYDITTMLPFRNYRHLCRPDPRFEGSTGCSNMQATQLTSVPRRMQATTMLRCVPTFRYLSFLLHRARTINLIISRLASLGHRLPPDVTPSILAKLSLTLDIPTNNQRLALFRNRSYWSDEDLYNANLFFIKLDMALTDPVDGQGEVDLRKMLLAQRSLDVLEGVLARTEGQKILDLLKMWVRLWHQRREEHAGESVLGVPSDQVGTLGREYWGRNPLEFPLNLSRETAEDEDEDEEDVKTSKLLGEAIIADTVEKIPLTRRHAMIPQNEMLLSLDQLVIAESCRRRLPLHRQYWDMITYGYVDPVTLEGLVPALQDLVYDMEVEGGTQEEEAAGGQAGTSESVPPTTAAPNAP